MWCNPKSSGHRWSWSGGWYSGSWLAELHNLHRNVLRLHRPPLCLHLHCVPWEEEWSTRLDAHKSDTLEKQNKTCCLEGSLEDLRNMPQQAFIVQLEVFFLRRVMTHSSEDCWKAPLIDTAHQNNSCVLRNPDLWQVEWYHFIWKIGKLNLQ